MSKHDGPGLFAVPEQEPPKPVHGPVYQGVCKQIRQLIAQSEIDRRRDAGTIAQARSLAASIDRVSGHAGGYQASGMQLAALHERLASALEVLTPVSVESDPFQELLDRLNDDEKAGDGAATQPHPEV